MKRRIVLATAAAIALGGAVPAVAAAQGAPAFTDYGRAATDQYGTPGGSAAGGGQPTTPPRGSGNDDPPGGGRGSRGGQGTDPDTRVGSDRRSGETGGVREQGGALPLEDPQGGSLPFTGLDLLALVLLALLLLCLGTALRLAARARAARSA